MKIQIVLIAMLNKRLLKFHHRKSFQFYLLTNFWWIEAGWKEEEKKLISLDIWEATQNQFKWIEHQMTLK